ncbi:MAG: 2-octaprenylphenol hydroxylase, partial [Pseudomonadota bacterium]
RWMSEQMGWRSVLKRIKNEAPFWAELLPTLPRKLDTFLSQDSRQASLLEAELATLKKQQQQQKQMIHVLLATVIALTVLSAWLLKG